MTENVREGLRRLGRTVRGRIRDAVRSVLDQDAALADRIIERDSQVNLANDRIQSQCFDGLGAPDASDADRRFLRSAVFISQNLERIGDCAAAIAESGKRLGAAVAPLREILEQSTAPLQDGVSRSLSACLRARLDRVSQTMRFEERLDELFRQGCETIPRGGKPEHTIARVMLLSSIERAGDYCQNIAEQGIFLVTGQRLKYHNLVHLERLLRGVKPRTTPATFQNIFEGESGARVTSVDVNGARKLLFKQDRSEKIQPEIEKAETWNRIASGIVPRIYGQHHYRDKDSFLAEFVEARMLQDVFLDADLEATNRALRALLSTLKQVWTVSARPEKPEVTYVRQIRERLEEVFSIHGDLARARPMRVGVGAASLPGIGDLLDLIEARQAGLAPPVSVYIHGDFNADNILYDRERDRIHFIDIHRSGPGDYAQDISTFVVGNVRNPIYSAEVVEHMAGINEQVTAFARAYARFVGDEAFDTRLVLARGRALITSGRLIADKRAARRLFLQGVYLLDQAAKRLATA